MGQFSGGWRPDHIICPHCATQLHGNRRKDNTVKVQCQCCGRDIIWCREGRRHTRIDTYVPQRR